MKKIFVILQELENGTIKPIEAFNDRIAAEKQAQTYTEKCFVLEIPYTEVSECAMAC